MLLVCGLSEFFWGIIMTNGYTGPKLKPKTKVAASKYRVPVLKDKAPAPKPGHHYGTAGLGTFMNAEKILRDVENKPKRGGGGYPLNPKLGGRDIGGKKPPWRKRKILE